MQAINLTLLGRGNQALAPASGTDLVRLVDLQGAIAGCVPTGQLYTSASITDFNAAVLGLLAANGVSLSGTGSVALLVNGGLKYTGGLLGIDAGMVSLVGHTHVAAAITDLTPAVLGILAANGVSLSGTGSVVLLTNGGLKYTGGALGLDSGTVSLVGHTHTSAAITDWNTALATWAAANNVGGSGTLTLSANGSLQYVNGGLGVNSGIVSFVGHQHRAVDVLDLPAAVTGLVLGNLAGSLTVTPSGTGPVAFNVVTAPSGGLLVTGAGLGVDLGTAHTQAAYGDHTHAQLHNPLTLGAMNSISGTLSGQQLQMEVRPVPGGGVLVTPSGVQVDWAVVQRAGAATSSLTLATANTPTVQLGYVGGVLSGTIPLDANPPGGTGGQIVAGVNGLRVVLGTSSTVAAAGNHIHTAATEAADGFLSASDKVRLDTLWATPVPSGIQTLNTFTVTLGLSTSGQLSGTVQYQASPIYGRGALSADANGLYVVLGTASNVAAAGNHLHDTRYLQLSGGSLSGTLTLAGNPTTSLMAATKGYVDTAVTLATGLPLSGGTLTGGLTLAGDPTAPLMAATKEYVDGLLSGTLSVMSGIASAATTANNPPSQADFNALVGKVNSLLSVLWRLGLPTH